LYLVNAVSLVIKAANFSALAADGVVADISEDGADFQTVTENLVEITVDAPP
jgi:hypothetical protein